MWTDIISVCSSNPNAGGLLHKIIYIKRSELANVE